MLADWYNTIDFDWQSEQDTETAVSILGTDGRLLRDAGGDVIHVTMVEKLLVLLLAKITNLVPEGGIWMNTQRPEWNDANNALVGKGLSIVTAAYLRRFIAFWQTQLEEIEEDLFTVNTAVATLFAGVQDILTKHQPQLKTGFTNQARRTIMNELGMLATDYRTAIYQDGLPLTKTELSRQALREFLAIAQTYIEQTLNANRRRDGLYHAYNILHLEGEETVVDHLFPMLEGQVAILSSGLLTPAAALSLLQNLRRSALYRADQGTYILYPNRNLPGFLQKNSISESQTANSELVNALIVDGDQRLLIRDDTGVYHFHGTFRNATDVEQALDDLAQKPAYTKLVETERDFILDLFETTFNHRAFTGRSGTFFAYEGLGSVYWHMVSKLLLAAQECYQQAVDKGAGKDVIDALAAAYYDIGQGLGFNKSPAEYGAFPTDPYSHTPMGGGARQPGMTGQVKEDILTRLGELGVYIRQGALHFAPGLLQREEFLAAPGDFSFINIAGEQQTLSLPADSLAFTFCQTPVIYTCGDTACIKVTYAGDRSEIKLGTRLDAATSQHIFARDGQIQSLHVTVEICKHLS
jgi:hypothetical protein